MVKTDIQNSKFMRITDNGSTETLLRNSLCASTTTIDLIKRKLYWIDECDSLLEEAELDASSPKTMAGPGIDVGFSWGLGQYRDECYYTQAEKVFRNGINSNATQLYTNGEYKTLFGLVVVHPSKQPLGTYLYRVTITVYKHSLALFTYIDEWGKHDACFLHNLTSPVVTVIFFHS